MSDLRKIAYNCRRATLLIEKKTLARLGPKEKMELQIHLAGCSVCRLFERQSIFINDRLKSLLSPSALEKFMLDDEYKKQLQAKIQKKIDQHK